MHAVMDMGNYCDDELRSYVVLYHRKKNRWLSYNRGTHYITICAIQHSTCTYGLNDLLHMSSTYSVWYHSTHRTQNSACLRRDAYALHQYSCATNRYRKYTVDVASYLFTLHACRRAIPHPVRTTVISTVHHCIQKNNK